MIFSTFFRRKKELIGIDEIRHFLKVWSDMTILDWRIAYDLPIKKKGGVFVALKSDLRAWQKVHPYVKEKVPEPREHRPAYKISKIRWGFIKIERRR